MTEGVALTLITGAALMGMGMSMASGVNYDWILDPIAKFKVDHPHQKVDVYVPYGIPAYTPVIDPNYYTTTMSERKRARLFQAADSNDRATRERALYEIMLSETRSGSLRTGINNSSYISA